MPALAAVTAKTISAPGCVGPMARRASPVTSLVVRWLRRLAALPIALGLIITAPALPARAFDFDTSQMPGFEILTAEDGAMESRNMIVVKYDGPIAPPMAGNLRAIWDEVRMHTRFEKFALRLNSPGGVDAHGMEVVGILQDIRRHMSLATLVAEQDLCASMCVAIFIQGETRYASPASAWMFHGASAVPGAVPSLQMTMRYFELFEERQIDRAFIDFLFENRYVTTPGAYWISGSELAGQSNIITNLLPNWLPSKPSPLPVSGILPRI